MQKVEKFSAKYPLLIVLLLSIPAVAVLAVPGFYGASDDLHIAWLHQMDKVIREGQIPPRFVPDLSYGFGYPLFNFVFPLPFYMAELFHLIGFSLVDSIKILFALSLPLSGFFMYKLLREFTKPMLALAGAVVYMYTPYRATDIYVRGAIGEAAAFIFLPLIILSIEKLFQKNKVGRWWIGILGLSVTSLILSHNIMAYMFAPAIVLYAAVRFFTTTPPRLPHLMKTILGLIIGVLISIYFWLPAVVESRLLKYDTVFNFKDHFPTLKQLVTPYFGYGASVPGPYDGMSFFIGIVNLALVVVAVFLLLFWRKKLSTSQRAILFWSFSVFFIASLMMNFRSSFIWDNFPLLPYFQFPWRFLSLTTLATSLFVIALANLKYRDVLGVFIIFITVITSYNVFKPHDLLGRTDDYYLNRYIPHPEASEEYKKIQEEYLRLPLASETRPSGNVPRIVGTDKIVNVDYQNSLNAKFEINSESQETIHYMKYLFPGWSAEVDGYEVVLRAGKPYGQIVFEIPPGKHEVSVKFKETDLRMVLNMVSLLTLLGTLAIFVKRQNVHQKN